MHLSFLIALAGAGFCLAQTAPNSHMSNKPAPVYLESRDNKHPLKHHQMEPFQKRELSSPVKRSADRDYDRAVRYIEKAKKSYERAQRKHGDSKRPSRGRNRKSRPVNHLQEPDFGSSRNKIPGIYDPSLGYNTGYDEDSRIYDGYNTGYGSNPPLPPMGMSPPSPFGGGGGGKITGGKDGTAGEIEAWGLKNGKIPEGADIEEEDKPDPEQDPSDNDDPPIVDGKPVAREE